MTKFRFKKSRVETFPDAPNMIDAPPGCYFWPHPSGVGFTTNIYERCGIPHGFVANYFGRFQREVREFSTYEERLRFASAIGIIE